jgi:uncharacterized protein (UPF0548 family)
MFRLTPAPKDVLERSLDRARRGQLTYAATGATATAELPDGFTHDHHEIDLGGSSAFARAKEGLSRWQAHVGAGITVFPGDAPAEGETLLVVIGFGTFQILAPCRIVYVVDEPHRFGLAYGTLPGHPESGEEAFIVERDSDGSTAFRITAFSRPALMVTRLAAPATRVVQRRVTHRYLQALARYVSHGAMDSGSGS